MPKRILVIDDNAPIRGLVRQFIEARPGFEVCGEAADGVEGVQKGQELYPDLIVLDFLMPRIIGLQAALILHEFSPSTPIILFTFYKEAIPRDMADPPSWNGGVGQEDSRTEVRTKGILDSKPHRGRTKKSKRP